MTKLLRLSLATLTLAAGMSAAFAAPGPALDGIAKAPVTVLTYGLHNLHAQLQSAFIGAGAAPFSMAVSPLSGPIADIATLPYNAEKGTITLNLVKIQKLEASVTPDDACAQAMSALRAFASLDPMSGKPYEGMESSALAYEFMPEGSPLDPAVTLPEIDKLFRLRYNGFTQTQRFACTADLMGTTYTLEVK